MTSSDIDVIHKSEYATTKISEAMIHRKDLVTGSKDLKLSDAYDILIKKKKGLNQFIRY